VPGQVLILGIGAHTEHFCPLLDKLVIQFCQISQLSGTDKSEVSWIKHNDEPLSAIIIKVNVFELTLVKGFEVEVW